MFPIGQSQFTSAFDEGCITIILQLILSNYIIKLHWSFTQFFTARTEIQYATTLEGDDVTKPQTGKRPEHAILENILVVMIDVIQADAEGGVIGPVILHLSITEAEDEVSGITSEAVCGKLKQSDLKITALPSVDQGISETKIIFAQPGFGTQRKGRDKYQNESKKSKFHM